MIHIPSFAVGSIFAGGTFLVLHRDLSHRARLSYRWELAEKFEKEFKDALAKAREQRKESSNSWSSSDSALSETWNDGVMKFKRFAGDTLFGDEEKKN